MATTGEQDDLDFSAYDNSEDDPIADMFALKVKTEDLADAFAAAFNACKAALKGDDCR